MQSPERPWCLIRASGRFAEGWLAARAPLSQEGAELLAHGEGSLVLILPIQAWQRLGVPAERIRLESAAPASGGPVRISAEEIRTALEAVLRGETATLPPWLHCAVPRPGGVLVHQAPVEAAYDLARNEAGESAAVVLRRVPVPPGQSEPLQEIQTWARTQALDVIDVFALNEQRRAQCQPALVSLPVAARLPVRHGTFTVRIFESPWTGCQHIAMVMGDVADGTPVLVRLHSECFTGDIMGSLRCDCGPQLDRALARISEEGRGVVLYLRQEGRGIGLYEKLRAYVAQDTGLDTIEANHVLGFPSDLRSYTEAAEMLSALGVRRVRLLTNNPDKISDLERHGVEVVDREPLLIPPNPENLGYLETKRMRMGHMLQSALAGEPPLPPLELRPTGPIRASEHEP